MANDDVMGHRIDIVVQEVLLDLQVHRWRLLEMLMRLPVKNSS